MRGAVDAMMRASLRSVFEPPGSSWAALRIASPGRYAVRAPMSLATVSGSEPYRVGLVHDHEDRAPALQFDDGPAQLLFVLVDWRVEDGVAVVVEGACVMRAFAYVEAEPDIDVSGLHVGLPSVGTFRPPRPCRGTVMTPGAGIHITRRPHPRPVAVFLRMGRVPISGRGRPACGGNTLRIMNDGAIRPYHTRRPGPAARDPLTNVMGKPLFLTKRKYAWRMDEGDCGIVA